MYYLNCVATVLGFDDEINPKYTDFTNHHRLEGDELDALLLLVLLFSPDELLDKVFFQNDQLCGDSNNEFLELSQVTQSLLLTQNALIGGKQRKVARIMAFKTIWLVKNYLEPLQYYKPRLEEIAKGNKSSGCCCTIL